MAKEGILVINPGSTSTKIALFQGETMIFEEILRHSMEEIASFGGVSGQFDFRRRALEGLLRKRMLSWIHWRLWWGGRFLQPIEGEHIKLLRLWWLNYRKGPGEHASNLGGPLAMEVGRAAGIPAYIDDGCGR